MALVINDLRVVPVGLSVHCIVDVRFHAQGPVFTNGGYWTIGIIDEPGNIAPLQFERSNAVETRMQQAIRAPARIVVKYENGGIRLIEFFNDELNFATFRGLSRNIEQIAQTMRPSSQDLLERDLYRLPPMYFNRMEIRGDDVWCIGDGLDARFAHGKVELPETVALIDDNPYDPRGFTPAMVAIDMTDISSVKCRAWISVLASRKHGFAICGVAGRLVSATMGPSSDDIIELHPTQNACICAVDLTLMPRSDGPPPHPSTWKYTEQVMDSFNCGVFPDRQMLFREIENHGPNAIGLDAKSAAIWWWKFSNFPVHVDDETIYTLWKLSQTDRPAYDKLLAETMESSPQSKTASRIADRAYLSSALSMGVAVAGPSGPPSRPSTGVFGPADDGPLPNTSSSRSSPTGPPASYLLEQERRREQAELLERMEEIERSKEAAQNADNKRAEDRTVLEADNRAVPQPEPFVDAELTAAYDERVERAADNEVERVERADRIELVAADNEDEGVFQDDRYLEELQKLLDIMVDNLTLNTRYEEFPSLYTVPHPSDDGDDDLKKHSMSIYEVVLRKDAYNPDRGVLEIYLVGRSVRSSVGYYRKHMLLSLENGKLTVSGLFPSASYTISVILRIIYNDPLVIINAGRRIDDEGRLEDDHGNFFEHRSSCFVCKRPLSDPISAAAGIGPECANALNLTDLREKLNAVLNADLHYEESESNDDNGFFDEPQQIQ